MLRPESAPPPAAPATRWEDWFDRVTHAGPTCCGVKASPFLIAGVSGTSVGVAVLVWIGLVDGTPAVVLLLESTAVAMAFVVASWVRTALGRGPHVLFEDLLVALSVVAAVAWLIDEPITRSVDRFIVPLGVLLTIGRLGCLASGCCHGRPARTGVRYPDGAIDSALADVRLFPLQLVEAAWIAVVTIGAACLLGLPAGAVTAFWFIAYGIGRFHLEFARGDVERPYIGPFSEAQWTVIVVILTAIVVAETASSDRTLRDVVALAAILVVLTVGRSTRALWWRPSLAVLDGIDLDAWDAALDALERKARVSSREVERLMPTPGVTVALSVNTYEGDVVVAAYRVTAPEHSTHDRETIAGLIAERLAVVRLLRAQVTFEGYELWAMVLGGYQREFVEVHRLHVLDRIRAFAFVLQRFDDDGGPQTATADVAPGAFGTQTSVFPRLVR